MHAKKVHVKLQIEQKTGVWCMQHGQYCIFLCKNAQFGENQIFELMLECGCMTDMFER